MRIVVLAWRYPSDEHPARGAFVREQARAVAGRHDVVVVCHDGPDLRLRRPFAIAEERRDGLRTLRLRHRPSPLAALPRLRGLNYRRALRAALDRLERPDVIHAHFFYVGAYGVRLGRERGIPVVLSEHSSAFPGGTVTGGLRRAAEVALGGAALVCPVSEHLREAIRASGFDVPMRVVPNPIDAAAFAPPARRPPGSPPVVVAVAGLTALKGIDALIDAIAATDARLVVVGDGEQRAALEAHAARRAVPAEFRGEVPKAGVARALAEADLFALPSLGETHGVAFVEAIASGLPVLGTRVGGVPEIVGPDDGELVPPGDPAALAAALRRMLESLDRYDRAAIRERALRRFGYEPVADLWDAVYRSVAAADQELGRRRVPAAVDERGLDRVQRAAERAAEPRPPGER
jgi:L-malate glycosyltransferase